LRKAINDLLAKSPEFDQEKVIKILSEEKPISISRLSNDVIKTGVEAFYR
jgi:hypothetical protein